MKRTALWSSTILSSLLLAGSALPAVLPAASAVDGIGVGDSAPSIGAKKLSNTKFRSLDQLKGRLILLEYYAHW